MNAEKIAEAMQEVVDSAPEGSTGHQKKVLELAFNNIGESVGFLRQGVMSPEELLAVVATLVYTIAAEQEVTREALK